MMYADIPTRADIERLGAVRAAARVSIYLPSAPLTQVAQADLVDGDAPGPHALRLRLRDGLTAAGRCRARTRRSLGVYRAIGWRLQ